MYTFADLDMGAFDFNALYSAIFENETSGSSAVALQLRRDVDGIAFGYNQINTKYNTDGYTLLIEIGATYDEIDAIKSFNASTIKDQATLHESLWSDWKRKNSDVYRSVNSKLISNGDTILKHATSHIYSRTLRIKSLLEVDKIMIEDPATMLALFLDYDNQFYFAYNGQLHKYLKENFKDKIFTFAEYLSFRLNQLWGSINPNDVNKRINTMKSRNYLLNNVETRSKSLINRERHSKFIVEMNRNLYQVFDSTKSLSPVLRSFLKDKPDVSVKQAYYSFTDLYTELHHEQFLPIIEESIGKVLDIITKDKESRKDTDRLMKLLSVMENHNLIPILSSLEMLYVCYRHIESALTGSLDANSVLITKGIIEKIISYCDLIQKEDLSTTYISLLEGLKLEYNEIDSTLIAPLTSELSLNPFTSFEFVYDETELEVETNMSLITKLLEKNISYGIHPNYDNFTPLATSITEETSEEDLLNKPVPLIIFSLFMKVVNKEYFHDHFYFVDENSYSYPTFIDFESLEFLIKAEWERNKIISAETNYSISAEEQILLETDNIEVEDTNRLETFAVIMSREDELQETYKPNINNLTLSGDVEVQKIIEKQADLIVKLNKATEEVERIKTNQLLIDGIIKKPNSSNIIEAIKLYFNYLSESQEVYAETMEAILYVTENTDKALPLLNSPDNCLIVMMGVYMIYAGVSGDEMSYEDYNNKATYDKRKHSLTGMESLPGWIDINQIRHEEWNPSLNALKDSDFWKYYANFYTFYESKTNPFNSLFANDPGFIRQQEYALNAKERLITDRTVLEEKLTSLFYGSNKLFNDHSLWTFTNLIADLFAELESPMEADILVGSIGDSFMNYFKNVSVEITSSLLLEILAKLMETDFITIAGQPRSLLDIYNDLLMVQKILKIMDPDSTSLSGDRSKEMDDLKTTLISTDNLIGKLLDSNFYFALDGVDFLSTEVSSFMNSLNSEDLTPDSFFDALHKNDDGEQWNLFSEALPAWYLFKTVSSFKTQENPQFIIDSKNITSSYSLIKSAEPYQKQYAFFCAIEELIEANQENYFLKLIEPGNILSGIYTATDVLNFCEYLPTNANNKNWDYVDNMERLYELYPDLFTFMGQPDFEYYLDVVDASVSDLNTAVNANLEIITGILMRQENGIFVDTIARLLPTTNIFVEVGNIPISDWLDKIISYFDSWILEGLDLIVTALGFEKKRSIALYERETRYLLKTNYENKVRMFSTLIDIMFNDALSLSICLGTTDLDDLNLAYEVLRNVRKELSKYAPVENSSSELGNDYENNGTDNSISEIDTGLDEQSKQEIVDAIKEALENSKIISIEKPNNSISDPNNVIVIVPADTEDSSVEDALEDGFDYIRSDEELLDHIESGSQRPIAIVGGDLGGSLNDFLKPSDDFLVESAKDQIVSGIIKDSLDSILEEITDSGVDFTEVDLADSITQANEFVSHSESGHLVSVDFTKVSSDKFLDSIGNFDFQDFANFRYTTLKMFGKHD